MLQVNFSPFPVLHTERLTLRQIVHTDAPEILHERSDPGLLKYIAREPAKSIAEVEEFIVRITNTLNQNEGIAWAICPHGQEKMVGTVALWRLVKENYRAEVGYVLYQQYQGKGIMSEALQAVLNYGFSVMGLHSIEAHTHSENIASQQVLLRQGFVQEGYFKEDCYFRGHFRDSKVFSLLAPKKV